MVRKLQTFVNTGGFNSMLSETYAACRQIGETSSPNWYGMKISQKCHLSKATVPRTSIEINKKSGVLNFPTSYSHSEREQRATLQCSTLWRFLHLLRHLPWKLNRRDVNLSGTTLEYVLCEHERQGHIVSDLIDNVTIIVRVDGDVPAPLAAANA